MRFLEFISAIIAVFDDLLALNDAAIFYDNVKKN
jgi:hypothetical protein